MWMNLYLPSVKLEKKVQVGSKVRRVYSAAQTPLERALASGQGDRQQLAKLQKLRAAMDPFELSQRIERKLETVYTLANRRLSPKAAEAEPKKAVEMTLRRLLSGYILNVSTARAKVTFLKSRHGVRRDHPRASQSGRSVAEVCRSDSSSQQAGTGLRNHLLAFSRQQAVHPGLVDLNRIVENLVLVLRRLLGANIVLVTQLAPALRHVRGDLIQIEQILLNLVTNARDAMPSGGRMTIETKNVRHEPSSEYPMMPAGKYVTLSVTDSGIGIAEEISRHVFEPFFTTKESGKGAGQVLSIVYSIVKQNGGFI